MPSAVLGNAATRVCFRVAESDARKLAEGYASFSQRDFLNLSRGEALVRFEQAANDCNLATMPLTPVAEAIAVSRREQIVAHTRATYARKREDVERDLASSMRLVAHPENESQNKTVIDSVIPHVAPVSKATIRREPRPVHMNVDEPALMGKGGAEHAAIHQAVGGRHGLSRDN
jgi:hypothetical protein